jgi:multidrug efflux pump
MLVIPLGVIGALAATTFRGLFNDIYFQVGLLAIIGLSAKNAILIVEFAVDGERRGLTAREAALEAARLQVENEMNRTTERAYAIADRKEQS